ncbi:MAG: septal ring lytic transglycosylase RlpA family protein [Candidatus Zhuqueibacterota bacterium]
MVRLPILICICLAIGCSSTNRTHTNNYEKDGIIFLSEEESEQKTASVRSNPSDGHDTAKQNEQNQDDLRDFKKLEGITYLTYDEKEVTQPAKHSALNRHIETGKASFYAMNLSGRKTASGEIYNPDKLTAAHPTLPFGTKVKVTNLYNRENVIVRINDRGPRHKSRIIDLSYAAAQILGIVEMGICDVAVEVVK